MVKDNIKITQIFNIEEPELPKKHPVMVVIAGHILDIGRNLSVGRNSLVIGRDSNADLQLNDDQISRRHCKINKIIKRDDVFFAEIEDLSSTNGTLLNGKSIRKGWVKVGETVGLGDETLLLFRMENTEKILAPSYQLQLISKDPLTNIYNRRAFDQIIQIEHEKARSSETPYCVLMLDLDYFKEINDTLGHPVGDITLRSIASSLSQQIRNVDILARIGGDEFALLLPNQAVFGGVQLAGRLQTVISCLELEELQGKFKLSLSIGIAVADPVPRKAEIVFKAADDALLKAKRKGRNRAEICPLEDEED